MRNKFLGTGDAGYHPLRKIKVVLAGLRFAILYDFSVAYKMVLSAFIMVISVMPQPARAVARRSHFSGAGCVLAQVCSRRPTKDGRSNRRLMRYCASAR